MASRDPNDLCPEMLSIAIDFLCRCRNVNLNVFFDCTYRSDAEQDQLYAQGRTAPGNIVTHARAGQSAHNCTLNGLPAAKAFDIAIYKAPLDAPADGELLDWNPADASWRLAHDIGRQLGLTLGADWPSPLTDPPHFELPDWQAAP